MIKLTVNNEGQNKDLFLWLTIRENGKDKLNISVTINETEELAFKNMHKVTERKWHYILGIKDEYIFDGSRKYETKIEEGKPVSLEIPNYMRDKVLEVVNGLGYRKLGHELFLPILGENKSIIKSEILLN